MENEMRICLVGASGRMGREIINRAALFAYQGIITTAIVAGIVGEEEPLKGSQLPGVKFPLATDWATEFAEANMIIDFSLPSGTSKALAAARAHQIPLFSGTTAIEAELRKELQEASADIPVLLASNTSIGMNVLFWLARKGEELLGDMFDVEIVELHHKMKKDAPSGSAMTLHRQIVGERGGGVVVPKFGRRGAADARVEGEIGVHSVRGGDVVGEHTVYYFGPGERIELTHRVGNRGVFALGALRGAAWLLNQQPGMYSMMDVLGVE